MNRWTWLLAAAAVLTVGGFFKPDLHGAAIACIVVFVLFLVIQAAEAHQRQRLAEQMEEHYNRALERMRTIYSFDFYADSPNIIEVPSRWVDDPHPLPPPERTP